MDRMHMEAMWRQAANRHGTYSSQLWPTVFASNKGPAESWSELRRSIVTIVRSYLFELTLGSLTRGPVVPVLNSDLLFPPTDLHSLQPASEQRQLYVLGEYLI
jgi:hypothetical protein